MKVKVLTFFILGALICVLGQVVYAIPIIQVTDDGWPDYQPRISGNNIVWYKWSGSPEVFLYNGSSIINLAAGVHPDISGNNIVYQFDNEIYHYDGSVTTKITDNSLPDVIPSISGNYVVWSVQSNTSADGTYLYDGTTIDKISNIRSGERYGISGNKIAWVYTGNLYFYDGSMVSPIASNVSARPSVSGNKIVYTGFDGNDSEIFLYDSLTSITTQITDNDTNDVSPYISGNDIVWSGFDGNDGEIFFTPDFGTTIIQKTDNSFNDWDPVISGVNVAWNRTIGDEEIMFASDVLEVWEEPTPTPTEPIPEPTTIVLMGFGLLGVLGVVIRQRRKEK